MNFSFHKSRQERQSNPRRTDARRFHSSDSASNLTGSQFRLKKVFIQTKSFTKCISVSLGCWKKIELNSSCGSATFCNAVL